MLNGRETEPEGADKGTEIDGLDGSYEKEQAAIQQRTLQQQVKSGELELEEPNDEHGEADDGDQDDVKAEKEAKPEDDGKIDFLGKKWTPAELETHVRELEAKKQEPVKSEPEKSEFKDKLAKLRQDYAGDEALLKLVDVVEKQAGEIDSLKGSTKQVSEEAEYRKVRDNVERMRTEVGKEFGVDLPSVDSPDFKKYLDIAAGLDGNTLRLRQAYLILNPRAKKTDDEPPKTPKRMVPSRSSPNNDTVDSEFRERVTNKAKAWGMKPDEVKQVDRQIERLAR